MGPSVGAPPARGVPGALQSGFRRTSALPALTELPIVVPTELERAWDRCLPGRQTVARNEILRMLASSARRG
jgi:hypothetical protein